MRIVFMGTAEFGVPSLRALHENYDVAAVVTRTDTKKGRGRKSGPSPVKTAARELGIEALTPSKLSGSNFIARLNEIGADLFYVVAFRILPAAVFTLPPKGTVNLHASLLPDYRGATPINHAVINGEKFTGLTTFFIDENIDTGDIIMKESVSIGPNETAGELAARLSLLGIDVTLKTVAAIADGTLTTIKQPMTSQRTAPKLYKRDGLIDWARDARSIHNQVRGMNPSPGAYTECVRGPVKIHRTKIIEETSNDIPGTVRESSEHDGFIVSCGKGSLKIIELQPPGKKKMDCGSFVRGCRLMEPGMSVCDL